MLRSEKQTAIEFIKDRFDRSVSAVFVDFKGLDVAQVTELRDQLRKADVEYKVVKNTLTKIALKERSYAGALGPALIGMTGIAWSFEDPAAAAKVLKAFKVKNDKLSLKGAVVDGAVITGDAVSNQLATMPGKDELRSKLLATFQAPMQQFLQQLQAPAQNFLYLLKAKESEGAPSPT